MQFTAYAPENPININQLHKMSEIDKDAESIKLYENEVNKYQILNDEELLKLFTRVKEWDKDARQEIAKSNLRLVFDIAKRNAGWWPALIDLIQEWNVWLFRAIDRYDVESGISFTEFAEPIIKEAVLKKIIE